MYFYNHLKAEIMHNSIMTVENITMCCETHVIINSSCFAIVFCYDSLL